MEVLRVEDGLGKGPFSKDSSVYPHGWGNYLPAPDEWPEDSYPEDVDWVYGCLRPENIRAMSPTEASRLEAARYYLTVYEVPAVAIIHAGSGRQVSFHKKVSRLVRRLCLYTFVFWGIEEEAVN